MTNRSNLQLTLKVQKPCRYNNCPQCNGTKAYNAQLCQHCYTLKRLEVNKLKRLAAGKPQLSKIYLCPQCNGQKSQRAKLCHNCYTASLPLNHHTCPQCLGHKGQQSKLCHNCYVASHPHLASRRDKNGYVLLYLPTHPKASRGYIYEHRLVWEQGHGHQLPDDWDVHHLNGIHDDNRLENLFAMPHKSHIQRDWMKLLRRRIRALETNLAELRPKLGGLSMPR